MHTAEVATHELQSHRMAVIVDLLAKGLSEPSKAPHRHPHEDLISALKMQRDKLVSAATTVEEKELVTGIYTEVLTNVGIATSADGVPLDVSQMIDTEKAQLIARKGHLQSVAPLLQAGKQ
jgi:hypothetical protein